MVLYDILYQISYSSMAPKKSVGSATDLGSEFRQLREPGPGFLDNLVPASVLLSLLPFLCPVQKKIISLCFLYVCIQSIVWLPYL